MKENSQVPVFVFPLSMQFFASDLSTHKRILTICNPYEFAVRFQILCSANDKNKYIVGDPQGSINSNSRVDIVIRHNAVNQHNIGVVDKFRIRMYQFSNDKVLGHRDVKAELLAGEPDKAVEEREIFQSLNVSTNSSVQDSLPRRNGRPGAPSTFVVCVTLLSLTTLLLPSHEDTWVPEYLKPTVNVKLVASYVLGLVTMIILRTA